ncbi:MAG: hypothetical protein ACXWH0_07830 [Acidimicrobiia bacterium]
MTALLTRLRPARANPPPDPLLSVPHRFVRGTLFWLYGLSASILIGSLWGSAVTGSRNTVSEVVGVPAVEQIAQERFAGWITDGLRSVGVVVPDNLAMADRILGLPETEQALARLTDQIVDAAFAPVGSEAVVDPASALLPAVPALTRVLADEGVLAGEDRVTALVSEIEPIPLDDVGAYQLTSAATRASAAFSLAAALAGVAVALFGGGAVLASPDRIAAVRNLAYRFMLTSLSLAVMLRLGSWIADPSGGATPLAAGISRLLGSRTYVPLMMAVVAAVIAAGAVRLRGRRERSATETV